MQPHDDVRREIRSELPYSHRLIRFAVSDGRVTLEGDVEWSYQKARAEAAVRRVASVKGISNLISVAPRVEAGAVRHRIEDALRRDAQPGAVKEASLRSWAERRGGA